MRIYMHPYYSKRYNYTPHEFAGECTFTCDSLDEGNRYASFFMMNADSDCTMYDTLEEVDYNLPSCHRSHEYVTQYIHSSELDYV